MKIADEDISYVEILGSVGDKRNNSYSGKGLKSYMEMQK